MTEYELGSLEIAGHDTNELTAALGLESDMFDGIVQTARDAWNHGETVSESIEYLFAKERMMGSEAVLALLILGRIWEETDAVAES
jgi:hypothetical protein